MNNEHFHSVNMTECDEISLDLSSDSALVTLRGEVDLEVRPYFRRVLESLRRFNGDITIDAQDVTFIDSSGIAVLGEIANEHPGRVIVLNAPPTMMFILEITALTDAVRIVKTEASAQSAT